MMRDDALNSEIDPLRTEMTGMKHIPISHVYSTDDRESKNFLADKNLSQVCYTEKGKSENVIADASYKEESKSKNVNKITNEEKYAIEETDHE